MKPLDMVHRFLSINGAFSLFTGLSLVIFASDVGQRLGVSIDGWLRILGVVLIGHCGIIMFAGRQKNIVPWVKLNLAAVAPYPLMMIGLVVFGLVETQQGRALVLADGLIVGLVAIGQWVGLRGMSKAVIPDLA